MKFNITNITKSKVVLKDHEAADADLALGQYISALWTVGLVKHCDRDIEMLGDTDKTTGFRIKSNGWEFKIEQAA